MKLSPSWEAASRSATQEFPNILWNPKVHYCVHKCLHWSRSWARWIQSIPSHPISLRSILIISTYLHLCLLSGVFRSCFPTKIVYAFLFYHMRDKFPSHFFSLDLIILITIGEEYKFWSFSLCTFSNLLSLHPSSVQTFSPQYPVLKHPHFLFLP
jgi:hypothetical protein